MDGRKRTRDELLRELSALRKRMAELEASERQRRRAECRLQRARETIQTLVDASTDVAILADLEGNILALNKASAEAFGKRSAELVGSSVFDLFPPEAAEERRQLVRASIASREAKHAEARSGRKWFHQSFVPVLNAEDEATGFAFFSRDITNQKQADEALRYQLGIERIVGDMMTSFAEHTATESETSTRETLRRIGEMVGVGLSVLRAPNESGEQDKE